MDSQEKESKLSPVILVNGEDKLSIGKITFYKSQSCSNENGENPSTFKTHIFRGVFENKMMVCVRRYEKASILHNSDGKEISQQGKAKDQFTRDIEALQEPQHLHENFIRYFCSEEDANFIFVAIEWCICSVEDLYRRDKDGKIPQNNWAGEKIDADIIKNSLKKKELLRQATEGLAFLHALGFVHRNLKPSNFMIAQLQGFRYLVKLSDFRMSKNPVKYPDVSGTTGSHGWTYPKPPVNTKADSSTYFSGDVFILGCFFHYVLTDGQHPFGDKHERESNMKNYDYYVDGYGWKLDQIEDETAVTLLKDMIKFNLEKICTLDQVLGSRYFLPVNFYNLYDLPGIKPGLCVIFNQEIFDNEEDNRAGSHFDEEYLKYVFSAFGFDVDIYQNLKAQHFRNQIDELAKKDFSFYASLVVCILSHGDEGVVLGVDSKNIKINELKYKFNSNGCPTLNGKPKIWIIQACQGGDVQKPIQPNYSKVSSKSDSAEDRSGDNFSHPKQQEFNELPVPIKRQKERPTSALTNEDLNKRPPLMDFLDVRASIPGYASFRNECSGSELIQYLCSVLIQECLSPNQEPTSFEDILKQVQSHINPRVYRVKFNGKTIEAKQTIEWRASLTDRIRLKKADTPGIVKNISISKSDEDKNWLTKFAPEWLKNFIFESKTN